MDDDDLDDLLDDYLSGRVAHNPEMENVEIVWIRDQPGYGTLHIARHDVTEAEVEEVLFELPPEVEAKRHKDYPDRTAIAQFLKPLTAFEPDEGEAYWRAQ
jgi:hypothetical protein